MAEARAPDQIVIVPQQIVIARIGERHTVAVSVSGHLVATVEPAKMDGGLLVVSAVDGPMPMTSGRGLRLSFEMVSIETDGSLRFEGTASVIGARGDAQTFPISGSARTMPDNPDCLIWDIVGGDVYEPLIFETDVRIVSAVP